ncbi:MAG: VWA domain-containing protein [Chloroflexota bacterium]
MQTKWPRILLTLFLIALTALSSPLTVFAQGEEPQQPQVHITQVDNSKFPNVTVYVSVTDAAGNPVGVDPATIQISENGQVMQPIDMRGGGDVGGGAIPVTTMLVMDISGSMEKDGKLDAAKQAAKTYVSQLRPGDQAGLMAYDTQVYNVQPVTSDIAALTAAIDSLQPGSDTAMYNALVEAEKNLANIEGRKAVIVLTDGLDNQSQSTLDDVVNGIGESGLTISAIGFGDASTTAQTGLDEAALKELAEKTGGLYSFATDVQALTAFYQQYGQSLQSEYAITYVSPSTLRDGVNRGLSVALTTPAGQVTGQGQYNPGGVLPEVTGRSWSLFGIVLGVLLLLLIVPFAINWASGRFGGFKGFGSARKSKDSRVRLPDTPSTPTSATAGGGVGRAPSSGKKPRIKIK